MCLRTLVFVLLINYVVSEQVPFVPCKGKSTVLSVVITPCNSREIEGWKTCILPHEFTVRVEAAVLAPFSASQLETVATATLNGHTIPLPNSGSNPCLENITPGCPVKEDRMYIFTFHFDVLKYYPSGRMQILFLVRDKKTKRNVGCVKLPVVISGQ
ncbi:mite group 2 allergen-like Ixo r 2 [Argiope bruennichi]|nr:mite group 2 allergen-like Ixo r 2 [Argiope bruennichi]